MPLQLRFVILICILLLVKATGFTQKQATYTSPSEQNYLLRMVDSAFWVVKVEYILRKMVNGKPEDFGKDKKDYFGRVYGPAIMVDGQLTFENHLLEPWKYGDSLNFSQLHINPQYKPVLSRIMVRQPLSKHFIRYDSLQTLSIVPTSPFCSIQLHKSLMANAGLSVYESALDSMGFVVLLHGPGDWEEKDSVSLSLSLPNARISFGEKEQTLMLPAASVIRLRTVIGGAYFTVKSSTGRLECQFAGLLRPRKADFILIPSQEMHSPKAQVELNPITPKEVSNIKIENKEPLPTTAPVTSPAKPKNKKDGKGKKRSK